MEKAIFTSYKLELVKDKSNKYEVAKKIGCPRDIKTVVNEVYRLNLQAEEVLMLLALNTKNDVIGGFEVHRGSIDTSIVHPREIFKRALMVNASRIVIAHNHPSGNSTPSNEDIKVTERIKQCGLLLGIELLDHIIVADEHYMSFKEKNLL